MFLHRLTLRRWATRMLLIWLLGVGVGIANACVDADLVPTSGLLASHEADADGAGHQTPASISVAAASLASTQADTDDDPGCHPRTHCADYCDKASAVMAQPKSTAGAGHGHALPVLVSAVVLPAPPLEALPLRPPRRDRMRMAPFPITLLRLAL